MIVSAFVVLFDFFDAHLFVFLDSLLFDSFDSLLFVSPDVLHGVALGSVQILAIALGLIWTLVNFYTFVPVVQSGLEAVLRRVLREPGEPRARPATPDGGTDTTRREDTDRSTLEKSDTIPPEDSDETQPEDSDKIPPENSDKTPLESPDTTPPDRNPMTAFEGDDPPQIDVLVPAYEEASVIEQSIASIREARYPQDRLSVTVLLEPDDEETPTALDRLEGYYEFDAVMVPERYPGDQSKPRALDYGFERTDGDIVGVIDAEDVIDPELFQEVATAIESEGHTVVQGRLDMVNEDDGWLNTAFRAEFGVWFDLVLPSFNGAQYPVPLGGTTCFFRRSALVAMSVKREERDGKSWRKTDELWARGKGLFGRQPWSVENVTEDFELGLFLWMDGHSVGYLEATTDQESPVRLDNWIRQRTRWEKGKLYTLLRYLRGPRMGLRSDGHAAMQSILPLLGPINVLGVLVLFVFANAVSYTPGPWVTGLLSLGLAFLVLVSVLYGVGYWSVSEKPLRIKIRRAIAVVATIPVYWILQWTAALRALWQLYNGWLHWERTDHTGRNGGGTKETVHRTEPGLPSLSVSQQVATLSLILLAGLGVRLYDLDSWALWLEEIHAVAIRGSQSGLDLFVFSGDPNPPGYYLVLKLWMAVFGNGVFSVRALSVVFAGGTIVAVFLLGRELFDGNTGLIAAFLLALSTYHVNFGRMASTYALASLLMVLSWYFFARLHSGESDASVGYLLSTAAMVYTHLGGLFVLIAQYVYLGFSEDRGALSLHRWAKVQGILLVGVLPSFLAVWLQLSGSVSAVGGRSFPTIAESSPNAVFRLVLGYLGYPSQYPILGGSLLTYALAFVVLLIAAAALLLAVASFHPRYGFVLTARTETVQMAVLFVVALLGPVLLSFVTASAVPPQYTFPASIGLTVLVARGLSNLPDRRALAIAVGVLVVSSVMLTGAYLGADTVEPWDRTAGDLEDEVRAGDVVVLSPGWIEPGVDHYYDGPSVEMIPAGDGTDSPTALHHRDVDGEQVWVVHYGTDRPEAVLDSVGHSHRRVARTRDGFITLYRFEPV